MILKIFLRLRMKWNPIVLKTFARIYFFHFLAIFRTENNLSTQKAILLTNV